VEISSSFRYGSRVGNENLVMQYLAELPGRRRHRPQRAVTNEIRIRSHQIFVPFRKPAPGCSGDDVSDFESVD
jgi:hypothetical protein